MKLTQKIPGTTILEIVIVMVISTIVVSIAFSVLNIVRKNMDGIAGNYEFATAAKQLEQKLNFDFNKHTHIFWDNNNELLTFTSPIAKTSYHFTKDSIVSEQQSFYFSLEGANFYYKGEEVSNKGNVDAVKLQVSKMNNTKDFFVFKYADVLSQFVENGDKN